MKHVSVLRPGIGELLGLRAAKPHNNCEGIHGEHMKST
jgi:hypothetical protein